MMTRGLLAALALGALSLSPLLLPATDAQTPDPSPGGVYRCVGSNPDGSPYRGVVHVTGSGDTWTVLWLLDSGQQAAGYAIWHGHVLTVIYQDERGTVGYAAFKWDADGSLDGKWSYPGWPKTVRETWTKTDDVVTPGPPPAGHGGTRL